MKKTLLASIIFASTVASVLAQGSLSLENQLTFGNVTIGSATGPYAAVGTYTVALLWAPGTTSGRAKFPDPDRHLCSPSQ